MGQQHAATDELPDAAEKVLAKSAVDDAQQIYEWLAGIGSTGDMKVELYRKEPIRFQGIKTDGLIDVFREPVTLDQIRDLHGGGKFQLRVSTRTANKQGVVKWGYAGGRAFDVGGNPKLEPLIAATSDPKPEAAAAAVPATDAAGPVQQAMFLAQQLAKDSRDEAALLRERIVNAPAPDQSGTKAMIESLSNQILELQRQMASKDERILGLVGKAPDTSATDKVLDMMNSSLQGEKNRLDAIRQQHDSELRQMREFHRDELARRETRFERELDAVRAAHAREVDSLRSSHQVAMETLRSTQQVRVDTLQETIHRLERELTEVRTETAALRARKEQGPLEQIEALAKLKNGFEALMPDDKDGDEPTWLKALEAIGVGDLVAGVGQRIATAGAAAVAPQEPMVAVRNREGQVVKVPKRAVEQAQARAAAKKKDPDAIDPADLKRAVAFLETAYRNGQEPETVARAARNLIPGNILKYLKQRGVDAFLNDIGLDDSSPLATVAGRMFVRKIGKFLLEGTTEGAEADAAAEAAAAQQAAEAAAAEALADDEPDDEDDGGVDEMEEAEVQ